MAGAPAPGPRQPRRGPAPIASFDHDVSDEVRQASSPESKQTFQLPEIREDTAGAGGAGAAEAEAGADGAEAAGLAPPSQRARSHSSPAVAGAGAVALQTPAAPRIDISRASSSSHHDSRDSSPELALFEGATEDGGGRLELGFREDGALELRSSTEELAFLEGAPGPAPAAPAPPPARRHSRKDSQGSEAALLAVSGRTSRLSSVGSQCSAHSALSALSRVSRLSVVSGASRSPSPHKMLLETSFCGPKPIEAEPELCGAAVEGRLLELARAAGPAAEPAAEPAAPANTRDRREVRTEVTVESARPPAARVAPPAAPATPAPPPPAEPAVVVAVTPAEEKREKESSNRARAGRSRVRRDSSEPEVYKNRNRSKDIIRIKLKPDSEYEDDDEEESERTLVGGEPARKPGSLALSAAAASGPAAAAPGPDGAAAARRRSPSPAGAVSRKSSFCSLFKSRETIASPDSPSIALRRKKSLTEGRARSKSRDCERSATPTSAAKIRGSVLALFKTPRRPSPSSRAASPGPAPAPAPAADQPRRSLEKLKYYEDTRDGVIHIPLRTPPDERAGPGGARRPDSEPDARALEAPPAPARPASAPQTTLPDGIIIIPLHSPTERQAPDWTVDAAASVPEPAPEPAPEAEVVTPESRRSVVTPESRRSVVTPDSRRSVGTPERPADDGRGGDARTESSSDSGRGEPRSPAAAPAERARRKQRLVFTTHVGSREQVFSTQLSITKTPSVTSEMSGSLASCPEPAEEGRPPPLRDTHIAAEGERPPSARAGARAASPRGSSGSEPSSGAGSPAARGGSDAEQRGLVVQESFEDELPYVPTTLPLERSLALPMVPVRERAPRVATAGVQRPRAAPAPRGPPPPPPAAARAPPPPAEKLRIKLPRRPRTSSAGAPPRPERPRTRSGGDNDSRAKSEWIDFEEVPERRKQPKRIQTLPAAAAGEAAGAGEARGVVFSYVEPEECRCECHAAARREDERPLLAARAAGNDDNDLSSPEEALPFVADFDPRACPVPAPAPTLASPPAPARPPRRH